VFRLSAIFCPLLLFLILFGLIAFSQAFIYYFILITDYGFNLSATREISIYRDSKEKISEIFSSVMIIKIALMFLSFLLLCSLVFSISKFRNEWLVYLLTFGMVLGNVLFPVWFFQGIERMGQIARLNILSKLIFTISIFVFIRSQSDYIYIPLINSLGFVITGLISIYIIVRKYGMKIKVPSLTQIKYELKEGWYIFISTVSISFYTISNIFILGLFSNNTVVGYYSAADKLIKAFQGLFYPVSQTIYPYISKLASESKEQALIFIRKIIKLVGGGALLASIAIFIFATSIVNIMLGEQYHESILILKILAVLPFIIFLTNMFGAQLLLPFNIKKLFSLSIIIPSILHIALLLPIAHFYKEIGVAGLVVFTELSILIYRITGLHLFHRDLFQGVCYGKR